MRGPKIKARWVGALTAWCFGFPMQDLVKVHRSLFLDVQDSILNKNASNLYQIFISYKER